MVSQDLKDQGYDREEEYFHKLEQERIRKYKEKLEKEESKDDDTK